MQQKINRKLVSISDAAIMLGVCENSVKHLIKRGELPSLKIARRRLIDVADIDALIERLKDASHDN